jgi:hypothetical protein
VDPFAEKKSPWPKIIVVVILLAAAGYILNQRGCLYKWFGVGKNCATCVSVPGTNAPPVVLPKP